MPVSKKRTKKPEEEIAIPKTRNLAKTRTGRIVIVILALSFVLSGFAALIYTLVQALSV